MGSFAATRLLELPAFLNGEQGRALARALGEAQDDEMELLRVAALSRLPAYCPDDALDGVGAWLRIERYAGEPNGAANPPSGYRGRLLTAWPTWSEAGSPQAIEDSLRFYGFKDVRVVLDYEGHWFQGDWYSRFAVIIGPDFGALALQPLTAPFTPPVTGGSTATLAQITAIKRQILKWKSVHSYPVKVILRFSGAVLGNINSVAPFTPPVDAAWCAWDIGKLAIENIRTGPFTPGGYEV